MTISMAKLISGFDTNNLTQYETTPLTPNTSKLILVAVASTGIAVRNGDDLPAAVPTLEGCGITWMLENSIIVGGIGLAVFSGYSDVPDVGTLLINYGGAKQGRCAWSVSEYANAEDIQQSATKSAFHHGLVVPLANFSSPGNGTFGAIVVGGGSNVGAGLGFMEIHEVVCTMRLQTQWRPTPDTTVGFNPESSAACGGIGLELVHV